MALDNIYEPAGTSTSGPIPVSTIGVANDDKVVTGGDKGGSALAPVANVGKRLPKEVGNQPTNLLGNFSSSTYHLTLYMISPDAYNEFVASGKKNINSKTPGAYVIAQSGGTPTTDPSTRASGFELDFYIDNLKLTTVLPAAQPTTTSLSFSIIEPYGFSFITKLNRALDKILSITTIPGYSKTTTVPNASRQFFVLSVSFRGYDLNGKVMTNADLGKLNSLNPGASGEVFDHYYPIIITSMKFKLDGKETKYDITAATISHTTGFGMKMGTVLNNANIKAGNVMDALGGTDSGKDPDGVSGLLTMINAEQALLVNPPVDVKNKNSEAAQPKQKYANVYKVAWVGNPDDIQLLKGASIISPADTAKSGRPMSNTKSPSDSNEATAAKAAVDSTKRVLEIKAGTSVIEAVDSIIKQSSWVEDTLKAIKASKVEDDSVSPNEVSTPGQREFKWYNLSCEVKVLGWNEQQSDFAYEITYIIQPYLAPAINAPFLKRPGTYYGAYKRYDYWLTGKNSEVIKIEQQFDNAYFNTMYGGTASTDGSTANQPNMPTNEVQQGRINDGFATHNAVQTFLKDPAAYTKTKIQILGDPDYLMPDTIFGSGFYTGDGTTINPSSQQVFIEIAYKEAQDYKNSNGLMQINGSVQFWPYSDKVKEMLKGAMCYMVRGVTSNFSKGTFIQDLDTVINIFPNYNKIPAVPTPAGGRGASNEGNGGESAPPTLASQSGAAGTGIDTLAAQSQITVKATNVIPFNAALDSQLASINAAAVAVTGSNPSAYVAAGTVAGFSPAKDSSAANVVADDDSYTTLVKNRLPAGLVSGRELSQTDKASGA